MALTKVSGGILDPGINVAGIVTATGFDGPFTGGTGSNINAGIITATGFDLNGNGDISGNLVIGGNLTANGDFTTLNTTLREVEILRVDANTTATAGIITQRGSGDIFSVYDTSTEVFKIADGGDVGIARSIFHLNDIDTHIGFPAADNISIETGGSERVRLNNTSFIVKNSTNFGVGGHVGPLQSGYDGAVIQLHQSQSGSSVGAQIRFTINDLGYSSTDGMFLSYWGNKYFYLQQRETGGGYYFQNTDSNGTLSTALTINSDSNIQIARDLDVDGHTNLDNTNIVGVATVSTRLNINTVSNARLAVAGTNYAWRGQFMIKDTTTGASAMPYMTFWDGSEANDGSNTGLLGRAGHVNGGGTNERFDFWTYRSTTPLSLGTNGYERLRILPAGQTLITSNINGTTISARNLFPSYTPTFQIEGNSKSTTSASLTANVNNTVGPSLWFAKTRGTSLGSNTAVQDDDELGTIVFNGADGTDIQTMGAYIRGVVDGSVGGNTVPGRLQFHTATGGTMYERLRITNDGKVCINNDNALSDLHICTAGSSEEDGTLRIGGSSASLGLVLDYDQASNTVSKITANPTYTNGNALLKICVDGNDNPDQLVLNGNGNIVLGHSAANARLHIASGTNSAVGDATNPAFQIGNTANYRFAIHTTSEAAVIANKNGDDGIAFHTKTANSGSFGEALRITSSGILQTTQDYPTFRPTLDFNFAAEKKLDPIITYTRSGVATFVNEFGKVVKVGENVPRFDHDPITRECKGLLIEETRTNVAESSEDFDNTTHWEKYSQSVVTNVATAPDGTLTADNIIPASGSSAARYLYFSNNEFPLATSTAYTTSIFVKKNGLRYFAFQAHDNGSGSGHRAGFDLDNGTVVTSNNMGSATGHSASIVEFPNGWFRCILTGTTAGSGSIGRTAFSFSSALDGNASVGSITADGSSGGYVWGHQVEAGAYVTSYIPTTSGREETRADDDLIIDGEDFTDFLNPSEGTIFADYKVIAEDPEIMYLSDDTAARRIGLYEAGSSQTRFLIGNSGTLADTTDSAGTTVGDNIKAAGAYKLNDVAAAKNGVISSTDSSVTIPPDLDRAYIGGYYNGTVQGILGLRRLVYYQQRLPNSQLIALTA